MSLKQIRTNKGFTQKQMAQQMAMEQTTYSKRENGKSPITDKEYEKLAQLLESSIDEIKLDQNIPPKNENCTFNDQSIGINYVNIPANVLDIILKYNAKLETENLGLRNQLIPENKG